MMMRTILKSAALALSVSCIAFAQTGMSPEALLDHMTGTWVLEGTIAGKQTTHDITADWVLGKNYVRLHEVSRDKDANGAPAYEAIVFIAWETEAGEFACLWLDTTGNTGLTPGGVGRAQPAGNRIPFLFDMGDGRPFHNTFQYNEAEDTWQWMLDSEREGELVPFARVTLRRK